MAEITRTVDYVSPQAREWAPDDGGKTMWFVEAIFDDGSTGSTVCFSKTAVDESMTALKALIGQTVTFGIKDKVKEFKGQKQYSLTSFPGKPAGGSGGGGRGGGGGMSHAQAGILAAASALAPELKDVEPKIKAELIIELGEMLTEHLFSRRKDEGAGGSSALPEPQAPAPSANAITLSQMKRLKELGAAKGYDSPEKVAEALNVSRLGDLSTEDANDAIELWS